VRAQFGTIAGRKHGQPERTFDAVFFMPVSSGSNDGPLPFIFSLVGLDLSCSAFEKTAQNRPQVVTAGGAVFSGVAGRREEPCCRGAGGKYELTWAWKITSLFVVMIAVRAESSISIVIYINLRQGERENG